MLSELTRRLLMLLRRRDAELDEEIQTHLRMATRHRAEQGESPEEARQSANREFGNVLLVKETTRNVWGWVWLETLLQDIRYGLRQLRKNPGFTFVAVLTLALGIGATIAVFSVMYALALRHLPVREPERLVVVGEEGGLGGATVLTYDEWKLFRDRQHVFSGVLAFNFEDTDFRIRMANHQKDVSGLYVSGDYFQTLGVPPFIGRVLEPSDDRPGAPPVCVLSYELWRRLYSQSKDVLGRTILVNGNEFQIVGVAPQSFFGVIVGSRPEIFMTLEAERAYKDYQLLYGKQTPSLDSPHPLLVLVGRLEPAESVSQANIGLRILCPEISTATPPRTSYSTGRTIPLAPLEAHPMPNDSWQQDMGMVLLLMAMAAVALIIACANLGNLLLARAAKRKREIATRVALGATRGRLVRQLLTESVALSAAAATAGLIVAYWGETILLWALSYPDQPLRLDLLWDTKLVLFAASVTLACALLFGLAPSIHATRVSLYSAMNSRSADGRRRTWTSNSFLILVQVTLSVAVLVSAGLLARTLHALLSVNPGYNPKGVLMGEAKWQGPHESPEHKAFVGQQLLADFRSQPGVTSAALIREFYRTSLPQLTVTGPNGSEQRHGSYSLFVSSEFFRSRQVPLLAGRDFNEGDSSTSDPVAILSEGLASALFGKVNAIGLSFRENDEAANEHGYFVTVVGVAGDMKFGAPNYAAHPMLYRPVSQCAQSCSGIFNYEIRVTGALPEIATRLKQTAANVDPNVAFDSGPLTDVIYTSVHRNTAITAIATIFSLFVALLAMIGVYGVTSYATAERKREIGIRMALGALPRNVSQMVIRETMVVVFIGIGLGGGSGVAATQVLRGLLWGVKPADPLSFGFAAGLMLLITTIAAYLPARRATQVDPMVALRHE